MAFHFAIVVVSKSGQWQYYREVFLAYHGYISLGCARLLLIMRLRDGKHACDMVLHMKAGTDPSRGPSTPWVQFFFFFFFYIYYIFYFCSWIPFQNLRSLFSSISLISLTQIATIQPKNLTKIIIKKFTIVIVFQQKKKNKLKKKLFYQQRTK